MVDPAANMSFHQSSRQSGMEWSGSIYSFLNSSAATLSSTAPISDDMSAVMGLLQLQQLLHHNSSQKITSAALPQPMMGAPSSLDALLIASSLLQPAMIGGRDHNQLGVDSSLLSLLSLLLLSQSSNEGVGSPNLGGIVPSADVGCVSQRQAPSSLTSSSSPYSPNPTPYDDTHPHCVLPPPQAETSAIDIDVTAFHQVGDPKPTDAHSRKSRKRKGEAVNGCVKLHKAKRLKTARRRVLNMLDTETNSPVSGMFIKAANDVSVDELQKAAEYDDTAAYVNISEESRRTIATIPNCIGDSICSLCKVKYDDVFRLAMHRCPRIVHEEYRCPECEKVFSCPANLASHRRWHRPKNHPKSPTASLESPSSSQHARSTDEG